MFVLFICLISSKIEKRRIPKVLNNYYTNLVPDRNGKCPTGYSVGEVLVRDIWYRTERKRVCVPIP